MAALFPLAGDCFFAGDLVADLFADLVADFVALFFICFVLAGDAGFLAALTLGVLVAFAFGAGVLALVCFGALVFGAGVVAAGVVATGATTGGVTTTGAVVAVVTGAVCVFSVDFLVLVELVFF